MLLLGEVTQQVKPISWQRLYSWGVAGEFWSGRGCSYHSNLPAGLLK